MPDILLATLNSTYQHTAFGLRYLRANLGAYRSRAEICEFTIHRNARDIVEELLAKNAKIIGFGVYIWNAAETLDVVRMIKKLSPQTVVVLGGPEVSHESESQAICQAADYVIQGEADIAFRELCEVLLSGGRPARKFIPAALPDVQSLEMPYDLYTEDDIKNRLIYVEASRGCPYKCEYCLSSLDKSVRNFPPEKFLGELEKLIARGVRSFKFIDRTFNLSPTVSGRILQFFLKHIDKNLFLHFEMVPDRLPQELRDLIKLFPAGSLQFEIGVQTFNPEVARNVSRRNDLQKMAENFRFLREETGVHTHADLIVGLPGETMESFAAGFDRLYALAPDEIQVGLLKRLKGTPIVRHDREHAMIYQDHPPYQILRTKTMSFAEVQFMGRFAKYWDLYANSGHFPRTLKELLRPEESAFAQFARFVEYLSQKFPSTQAGIALLSLAEAMYEYLIQTGRDPGHIKELLRLDYGRGGRRTLPAFLLDGEAPRPAVITETATSHIPARQRNHLTP